jgi:hypothetical protein
MVLIYHAMHLLHMCLESVLRAVQSVYCSAMPRYLKSLRGHSRAILGRVQSKNEPGRDCGAVVIIV